MLGELKLGETGTISSDMKNTMLTHLLHKYLTLESCARCKRIKRRERERAHFLFTLLMCFSCFSLSPPLQKAPGGAGDRESGRGAQRAGQPDAEHSGRHWHLPLRWGAHQWEEVSEVAQETGETVENTATAAKSGQDSAGNDEWSSHRRVVS